MMNIARIKAACGRIAVADGAGKVVSLGTGYLVREDRVVTCQHVVNPKNVKEKSITISFKNATAPVPANLLRWNDRTDCAVLELLQPLPDARPLALGGNCEWKASWNSYGFPSLAKGAGIALSGLVSDPDATDDQSTEVLELTSEEAGAGMAAPFHGFSGSPVVVGDVVVGHLKRYLQDPQNPLSAAWGKVYATRSACVWGLLDDGGDGVSPPPVTPPPPGSPMQMHHVQNVRRLLEKSSAASIDGVPNERTALAAAESLIQLGQPVEALNTLLSAAPTLRNSQLRALALAKIGIPETLDASVKILEDLRNRGNFDPETSGLLGGRYKQIWQRSRDLTYLQKSHAMYLDTFEQTKNPYNGINAAATALWLKQKPASEQIAHRVLGMLKGVTLESTDPWDLATKGEAFLLSGDLIQARDWYARAARECKYAEETVQTMRRQAELNLDALGLDMHTFDGVFRPK